MGAVLTGCAAATLQPECERPIDVRSDAGTTRLCDAERQEYELAMQVLGQIADRPRRTQEQRLANSCLQFIRALRDQREPIRDAESHAAALARVDALLTADPDIQPGTPAGDELDALIDRIEQYEDQAQAQRELGTDTGLAQLYERAKLLEQAHGG